MSLQRKLVMPALYRASTALLLMSKEDVDGEKKRIVFRRLAKSPAHPGIHFE
jgi:hypothetical protein